MDWIIEWIAPKLGPAGIVLYLVVFVLQHFSKSDRAALVEMVKGLWSALTNIPRRWKSERDRMREKIAKLRAAGLEDAAAVKEVSLGAKAGVRVAAGVFEDVMCRVIDLAVVLVPFLATLWKAVTKHRKPTQRLSE